MTLPVLCLILIGLFIVGNVAVGARNSATLNPWKTVMSEYLAGHPLSDLQDTGFFSLALALPLFSFVLNAGDWVSVPLWIAGVALVLVVVTKIVIDANPSAPDRNTLERLHVEGAGIAFLGLGFALGMYSFTHNAWVAFALICAAPVTAFVCYRLATKDELDAYEEHAMTAFELASMIAILVPFIH